MKKKYKSAETEEAQRKHQFGRNDGNKRGNPSVAVAQREFYRWCETVATADDLENYYNDESNPAARRKFVNALMKCQKIQDFFDLTNQTHGLPKQAIEVEAAPTTINIVCE